MKKELEGLTLSEMDEKLKKEKEELLKLIDEYNDKVLDMRMWAHSCGSDMKDLKATYLDYE